MKVIYATQTPRFIVESADRTRPERWTLEKGFITIEDAIDYAKDQQLWYPRKVFRVVDRESTGTNNDL